MSVNTTGQEHETYQQIFDCVSEALIFSDVKGIIVKWNAGAEALFGYSAAEAIGQSLDLIIPDNLREAHWNGFNRAIASGESRLPRRSVITRSLQKNGPPLYVDMSFAIAKNPLGQPTGAVAVARDATQRYLEEKKLRQQLRELKA